MKKIAILSMFLGMSACKVHIMNSDLVSMTTKSAPSGAVTKGNAIQEGWCLKDKPVKPEPDNRYGLMDQVILKAQQKHQAKYIADASFYTEGSCITMTGSVVK